MSSSIYRAVNTTLIYIECGGEYLMLAPHEKGERLQSRQVDRHRRQV